MLISFGNHRVSIIRISISCSALGADRTRTIELELHRVTTLYFGHMFK